MGDSWTDQTRLSGHQDRLDDLDLFAGLGISALRYPVLWERTAPDRPETRDFAWSDARLARLRLLGIRPILGLVHHGAGPAYTALLDDGFAAGLAGHAGAVARRYPWVADYTPVNEPLTTARFACLYGYWHPHACNEALLWRALLNQVDATRRAMRAIRAVNPSARLIATDDLGHAHATPERAEEASFENERRWLGWDLLFGRVTRHHPLHDRLAACGLADRLRAVAEDPCPPDVIGVNHYLTSERLLDHRLERYPGHRPAADHARPTISTEIVRAAPERARGVGGVLREAWARYGVPLAVTEAHNGCTREEQMRWFDRVWRDAATVREAGVDVRAVTAWSLLGAHGWDRLCTGGGRYEPGVFDARGPAPRATAMVPLLRALAGGREPPHAAMIASPGWWEAGAGAGRGAGEEGPPILVTGRTGTLGRMIAQLCRMRGLAFAVTDRRGLRIDDVASIEAALERVRPWAVINTAGLVDIDRAEREQELNARVNAHAPGLLARACAARGIRLVTLSSDQVFDGCKGAAYVESDAPAPLNAYGWAKAEAERRVLAVAPDALVVRSAAFFSPHDFHNFAAHALEAFHAGRRFDAAEDSFVSPTYVPDLVQAMLDLLIDGECGVWHLATPGRLCWADFARTLAEASGMDAALVGGRPSAAMGWQATRPRDVSLVSERGTLLPPLADAVARMVAHYVPEAHRLRPAAE